MDYVHYLMCGPLSVEHLWDTGAQTPVEDVKAFLAAGADPLGPGYAGYLPIQWFGPEGDPRIRFVQQTRLVRKFLVAAGSPDLTFQDGPVESPKKR